jgi:type I restriction enzyme R subunit
MAFTDINTEDRLVQKTFADHLEQKLGWENVYAWNTEVFGTHPPSPGTSCHPLPVGEGRGEGVACNLTRTSERDVVLGGHLRDAIQKLNPDLPDKAVEEAAAKLTQFDFSRSTIQHNRDFYHLIRGGVPMSFRDEKGNLRNLRARVIDFRNPANNRFVAVRELKIQGLRSPHYNRRADLVCFVNGLPVVFIELKAVYVNIRAAYDGNLSDYYDTIPHAFYHNAFVIVSNGDRAKYGSITADWARFAEWKRNDEKDSGSLEAPVLLDGMLAKDRLLDLLESFILFDDSKPGATRKIVANNHQVLGVNNAVASVLYQEDLKRQFPGEKRLISYYPEPVPDDDIPQLRAAERAEKPLDLPLVKRAHPDLGRLGVFWHTQGSGKSYSMVFFVEKVRRTVPGNFTFVVMTDRDDLDGQIYRSFIGCGIVDAKTTPRASSGRELKELLQEDHRFIFSLIHKFNQSVSPEEPYSKRDDIIVLSDEAHRTQAGKLARNMRLALPNASFIGFTGTPLFKHDHITRRIFGDYISRYDFKRSEEDGATVKLVYENRGERLGITTLDLNDRIADKIDEADLDADQIALLEKLLGKDYEIITADDRLEKVAADFVEHFSTRWESGKAMLVCIDKLTCARVLQLVEPRWKSKMEEVRQRAKALAEEANGLTGLERDEVMKRAAKLNSRADWMAETLIQIIISEGQNEVKDFAKWGFDIRPHRALMKEGFEAGDGKTVDVETAFKDPAHPFRAAIVCAMWLTGFDVECLSTLYIDKPMRAHSLMQAIARANRVYPGKACGVIVDYNGMLKSLREALAQYALGDDENGGGEEIVAPIEELLKALVQAIEAAENHLAGLGFDSTRLIGAKGFNRISALRDAVDVLYTTDEAKRRFEIMARVVFERFKALLMEPSVFAYAERHDNIEAIYKKLQERRDTADVTDVLKELHRIVNQAIQAQEPGEDRAESKTYDLSKIDFDKLREEFAKKVSRKKSALKDIRDVVEAKLQQMMATNPLRMDFYKKYQEIIADYNREKDRVSIEETFARLLALAESLDSEQKRAVEEGLSENELALFDLLTKPDISKTDRERVKQSSRSLLAAIQAHLKNFEDWTAKEQTQADIKIFVIDQVFAAVPQPPYSPEEAEQMAERIYEYVFQKAAAGTSLTGQMAA